MYLLSTCTTTLFEVELIFFLCCRISLQLKVFFHFVKYYFKFIQTTLSFCLQTSISAWKFEQYRRSVQKKKTILASTLPAKEKQLVKVPLNTDHQPGQMEDTMILVSCEDHLTASFEQ